MIFTHFFNDLSKKPSQVGQPFVHPGQTVVQPQIRICPPWTTVCPTWSESFPGWTNGCPPLTESDPGWSKCCQGWLESIDKNLCKAPHFVYYHYIPGVSKVPIVRRKPISLWEL